LDELSLDDSGGGDDEPRKEDAFDVKKDAYKN